LRPSPTSTNGPTSTNLGRQSLVDAAITLTYLVFKILHRGPLSDLEDESLSAADRVTVLRHLVRARIVEIWSRPATGQLFFAEIPGALHKRSRQRRETGGEAP
jgi:hypothetical protein